MVNNNKPLVDSLKESAKRKDNLKENIIEIVRDLDYVELLCHLSLLNALIPQSFFKEYFDLDINLKIFHDNPSILFLSSILLKEEHFKGRTPKNSEIESLIHLINEYFISYRNFLIIENSKKKEVTEKEGTILRAQLQKIMGQVTSNMYNFQIKELVDELFSKFENYYLDSFGFTPNNAWEFGNSIIERYAELIKKRGKESEEAKENYKKELKLTEKSGDIRKMFKETFGIENDDEIIEKSYQFIFFYYSQEIFLFDTDKFCEEEGICKRENFQNYLNTFSCKFGEENKKFENPLDKKILSSKPIINIDEKYYFTPIYHNLREKLPFILESLLESEKQKQSKVWQRYQKSRAKFSENKCYHSLSRMFSEKNVYRNLEYKYKNEEREVDILCKYDNKIIIAEAKAGTFSDLAQRGHIKRLKWDLKKLLEDAFKQGKLVKDYIQSEEETVFIKKNGESIKMNYEENKFDFILISATLESLMSLSIGLKKLQSLGLFKENEYPWGVNVFDIDIITDIFNLPSVFIHYIENRLESQDEDIFMGFDELSFLGYYLKEGNIYTPLSKEGKEYKQILLDSSFLDEFDKHYLLNEESPKLNIEKEWLRLMNSLENSNIFGYSRIASALLNVPHKDRKRMIRNIENIINYTYHDKKEHDYTEFLDDVINSGYTFITNIGRDDFEKKLVGYCNLKKYQCKANKWVGIGLEVKKESCYISHIFYNESDWKFDNNLENLIENNLRDIEEYDIYK